jgi:transposase-like protein
MAKRTRAPARKRKKAKKAGRPFYTPEFLAEARRRVEQTLESMTSIAGKFGMHHSVLSKLIKREGWVRPEAALHQRGLSPAMRLAATADGLLAAAEPSAVPAPHDISLIDRLEQAVLRELATVETMRASLANEPLRPMDAERTARTLSVLTETLAKLRRLRLAAAPQAGSDHDDDLPADLDAFRIDLARRIDAFVASRTEPGDAERDAGRGALAG